MNSSRVIKSSRQGAAQGIMVSRQPAQPKGGDFHALSSMWQSADQELVAALSELEAERDTLRQEIIRAKEEAEAMVAAAEARVEEIERQAFDKGFGAGKEEAAVAEGQRLAEFAARLDTLLAGIEGERRRLHLQYEADILALVKAMVDRVLFHEVTLNPQVIEVCLKTALGYVVESSAVTVRLHGQDLEHLRQVIMARPEMLAGYKQVELSEDPTVARGGCLLETSFGEVDATIDSRRAKVCAAIDAVLQQAAKIVD